MRTLTLLTSLALLLGCGASPRHYQAEDMSINRGYAAKEAPAGGDAIMVAEAADDGGFDFADDAIEGEMLAPAAAAAPPPPAPAPRAAKRDMARRRSSRRATEVKKTTPSRAEPSHKNKAQAKEAPEGSMVVYSGRLNVRVRRPLEAMDAITLWVEEKGGYIQSMTDQVIVVRVPSKDFEAALVRFAALGEILNRQVEALDVSAQFTDVSARLAVSREARARLLVLLEQVKTVQERLRVLQEIKRLSEQIETMESILNTLQKLADFSTITVTLTPMVANAHARLHHSPFPWVRDLEAHRPSIREGGGDVKLELPKGFVHFDKEDYYRAQAADTTLIRAGAVANEPLGDASFWAAAVHYEMNGRDEEHVEEGAAGALKWHLYRSKTLQPRYYLIGVQAVGDRLFAVEVFFPNEAAWSQHGAAVKAALNSFKVK